MTTKPHDEVQELLGVYALDALDGDELAEIELHLAECPRCRAEVEEYREAAAQLAFTGMEAPAGVWQKIQAALEEAPPEIALARVVPFRPSRWQSLGARLVATAAVVISLIALGVAVTRSGDSAPSSVDAEIASAALDPAARQVHLVSSEGRSADVILLPSEGKAFLAKHSLPKLAADETYQLWGQQNGTKVSLGVLGSDPGHMVLPLGSSYEALAITAEKKPGVVASDNPAVVAGLVPTS